MSISTTASGPTLRPGDRSSTPTQDDKQFFVLSMFETSFLTSLFLCANSKPERDCSLELMGGFRKRLDSKRPRANQLPLVEDSESRPPNGTDLLLDQVQTDILKAEKKAT